MVYSGMTQNNDHERQNSSILARTEKRILVSLVRKFPDYVTPNMLTLLGFFGALVAFFAFLLCNWSAAFLPVAAFGIFLHWFGDSTDGTLARFRGIERPQYGYMIDHSFDLISNALMFIGLGLSPYFTFFSAVLAISMYYLFSAFTYLKVAAMAQHTLAYGGLGATEMRLLIICWAIIAWFFGPTIFNSELFGFRSLDFIVCVLWSLSFLFLCFFILAQLKDIWRD
jgi:archaetidylinositol phosphate synthase